MSSRRRKGAADDCRVPLRIVNQVGELSRMTWVLKDPNVDIHQIVSREHAFEHPVLVPAGSRNRNGEGLHDLLVGSVVGILVREAVQGRS